MIWIRLRVIGLFIRDGVQTASWILSPAVSVSQISSLSIFNWRPGLISISYGDIGMSWPCVQVTDNATHFGKACKEWLWKSLPVGEERFQEDVALCSYRVSFTCVSVREREMCCWAFLLNGCLDKMRAIFVFIKTCQGDEVHKTWPHDQSLSSGIITGSRKQDAACAVSVGRSDLDGRALRVSEAYRGQRASDSLRFRGCLYWIGQAGVTACTRQSQCLFVMIYGIIHL